MLCRASSYPLSADNLDSTIALHYFVTILGLSERNVASKPGYLQNVWKEPHRGCGFVTFVTFLPFLLHFRVCKIIWGKYVPCDKYLGISQNSKVWHFDISKCHKMTNFFKSLVQNYVYFSLLDFARNDSDCVCVLLCCMTRYLGIVTVPGFPHERAKGARGACTTRKSLCSLRRAACAPSLQIDAASTSEATVARRLASPGAPDKSVCGIVRSGSDDKVMFKSFS